MARTIFSPSTCPPPILARRFCFAANGLSDRLQQKGAATVILILDACRDNPFAMQGKRSAKGSVNQLQEGGGYADLVDCCR
jgi:hypothetical protein